MLEAGDLEREQVVARGDAGAAGRDDDLRLAGAEGGVARAQLRRRSRRRPVVSSTLSAQGALRAPGTCPGAASTPPVSSPRKRAAARASTSSARASLRSASTRAVSTYASSGQGCGAKRAVRGSGSSVVRGAGHAWRPPSSTAASTPSERSIHQSRAAIDPDASS